MDRLAQSYFPNGTPNKQAVKSLYGAATRRFASRLASFQHSSTGNYSAAKADWQRCRCTISDHECRRAESNHTAVMIVNDYQDSYFVPSQLMTFFDQLTVPKRLQLAWRSRRPGAARAGGHPSALWTNARSGSTTTFAARTTASRTTSPCS